jgi:hypothetical protein
VKGLEQQPERKEKSGLTGFLFIKQFLPKNNKLDKIKGVFFTEFIYFKLVNVFF